MGKQEDGQVWMVAGALGSIILAVLLIPLRTLTPASNLAFAFLAFTIVVAELGGRSAAFVTALASGMSLNFFLTQPYLSLTIEKPDDVIAFFALLGCGLIAAWFGKRRARVSEVASRARTELDVLKRFVDQLTAGAPLDQILGDLQTRFGLRALVVRDSDGRILGVAPVGSSPPSTPQTQLTPQTLFPSDAVGCDSAPRASAFPPGAGALCSALVATPCPSIYGKGIRRGSRWTKAARWRSQHRSSDCTSPSDAVEVRPPNSRAGA